MFFNTLGCSYKFPKMQIHANLQRVLILLSTIVVATDCCASKIITLKEHNLKMLYQQNELREQHSAMKAHQQTQMPHKIPQHVELATETNFGKIANSSNNNDDNKQNKSMIYTMATFMNMEEYFNTTELSIVRANNNSDGYEEREDQFQREDLYYSTKTKCNSPYLTEFCFHNGLCYSVPVRNHTVFFCECADGYGGERCEYNNVNYEPQHIKRSKHILTARVILSYPTLIMISVLHVILGLFVVFRSPSYQQRNVDTVAFRHLSGEDAATVTAVIA